MKHSRRNRLYPVIAGMVFLLMLVSNIPAQSLRASGRDHARSMVVNQLGIVATSQVLASRAGAYILERGGNAIDAAIAANAVLTVVEPMSCGIGGDLFAIVYEAKTGQLYGLNASGWAPQGQTLEYMRRKGYTAMPQMGIDTVTVPGTVAGWSELRQRFGRLSMAEILAPAIHYAAEGFPVSEIIAADWATSTKKLQEVPEAARVYLPGGKAPALGQIFKNQDMAQSLRLIAERGRDGFYKGPIAESIVELSNSLGGVMQHSDLADFQAEWVTPISTTYRGWKVYELPPNGQGIAALEMLNILEPLPIKEYGPNSTRALHSLIEAKKLAYADLLKQVGDPRHSTIPVNTLLSKEFAAQRARLIKPGQASCQVTPAEIAELTRKPAGDTIYLSVVDKEGNIVSLIQSIYQSFGSALVPKGTGFVLHNRGGLFSLEPNHPNTIASRRRPLHTIIPAFMEKGDRRIGFGIMGGWNQAQAHVQFVLNVVDYDYNLQEALEAARVTKLTFDGCDVQVESRVDPTVRQELEALGHKLTLLPPFSSPVGGGQAVERRAGVNFAGSDPRKDGAAIPEAPALRTGAK